MLPCNHISNFPAEWWNERRKRDYFVDEVDCVNVRPGSPTDLAVRVKLKYLAYEIAVEQITAAGSA